VDANRVRSALGQLADRFTAQEQAAGNHRGWGQFLDVPREHLQIGSYGTASALLALALANRTNLISADNAECLSEKWAGAVSPRRSSQTLRLAFTHLALRGIRAKSGGKLPDQLEAIYTDIRQQLLSRCINNNAWGDWWVNASMHDREPSVFTSSIVVLSFAILEHDTAAIPGTIDNAVREIESNLQGGQLSTQQSAAALAALAAYRRGTATASARAKLKDLCSKWAEDRTYPLIHFYDFRFTDARGHVQYDRDYFIVPRGVLLGIASIYWSGADWRLRLEADRIINLFLQNVDQHNGLYKVQSDQYAATKDQAWVALLLALNQEISGVARLWHTVLIHVVGPKPDTVFWSVILPITIVVGLEGLAFVLRPTGELGHHLDPPWTAEALSIFLAAVGGMIAHYFSGRVARKLLPGY
jgi:hypothetical protein